MKLIGITPKIFDPIYVKTKLGDCSLLIKKEDGRRNLYDIRLQNKQQREFAHEWVELDTTDNFISGILIESNEEYRQKGFRFGEIIRLGTLIELIENNMNLIDIYAKETAAIFHHKYKFKSSIADNKTAKKILEGIIQDKNPDFKKFGQKAKLMIDSDNFADANTLVDDYLSYTERGKYNINEHKLSTSLPMKLDIKDVYDNADFFNKLYENHGIDYKI